MNLTAKQQLSRNPSNAGYATPLKTYSIPAATNEDGTVNVPAQPVYGIDPNVEPIDMYMAVRPTLGGNATATVRSAGIGAAGQAIACPAGFRWMLLSIVCDITTTATVGNRIIQCRIRRQANFPEWIGAASAAVAASQVGGYDVNFGSGGPPNTTVRRNIANTGNTNVQVREYAPGLVLNASDDILIEDSADIDVADTLLAYVTFLEYRA